MNRHMPVKILPCQNFICKWQLYKKLELVKKIHLGSIVKDLWKVTGTIFNWLKMGAILTSYLCCPIFIQMVLNPIINDMVREKMHVHVCVVPYSSMKSIFNRITIIHAIAGVNRL